MNKESTFYNLLILTKPGIIVGNILNSFAGFFLASKVYSDSINFLDLTIVILSIILIIASGCVFNNIYDRDIDKLMQRTKNRPLVLGKISVNLSFFYGLILAIFGFSILYYFGNILSFITAIIGFLFYVVIYTIFLKRNSIYDIHVGSIAGSMPPLIAYFFVSSEVDFESIMLFVILSLWQIPHSLAITLYRMEDFKKANIVIMPLKKGIYSTKKNIIFYIIAFFVSAVTLFRSDFVGLFYLISISIASLYWIYYYFKDSTPIEKWSKKILFLSILVIFIFDISLVVNSII
ncbi:MAG: protoheme IX farnesyltransferase [Ulvibacter sp.]